MEEKDIFDELMEKVPKAETTGLDHVDSSLAKDGPEIVSSHNYFVAGFSSSQIVDARAHKAFIKAVERQVRTSIEYSKYLSWLKSTEICLDRCSIMSNITDEDASIEMHHYPFSLFDLCDIVAYRQFEENPSVTTFTVADEVLELHFKNLVGLVPLSITMHNLVHSGSIFINLKQVFGKVKDFVIEYKSFITEEMLDKLVELLKFSAANVPITDENSLSIKEVSNESINCISHESIRLLSEKSDE